MIAYIIRRVLAMIPMLIAISFISFVRASYRRPGFDPTTRKTPPSPTIAAAASRIT